LDYLFLLELALEICLHQSEWLRSKIQVTADAGEDVEKEEHSSIAGGIASLYSLLFLNEVNGTFLFILL
jgi:hypothetical protein